MAGHLLSIKVCVDCISKPYIKFVTVQKQIGMNDITDRNKLNTYEETLKHCKIKASGIIQKLRVSGGRPEILPHLPRSHRPQEVLFLIVCINQSCRPIRLNYFW